MAKSSAQPADSIPRDGVIVGGVLDGWRYTLLRVVDDRPRMRVVMDATVTQPDWPFPSPRPVRLAMWQDFDQLLPFPTTSQLVRDQPVMLDFQKLLAAAVKTALELDPDPQARAIGAQTIED